MVFKGEDGPITYHLVFRFYQFDNNAAELLASSGGWYEGMVNFDGVKKHLKLIDGNVNGAFNDMASDPYDSDRVEIEGDKTETNCFWARCWKWTGNSSTSKSPATAHLSKCKRRRM